MKILHLTDTHLGVERAYVGAEKGWSRAADHAAAFEAALGPALREEVDFVVHSGDLFNRSLPPRAVAARAAATLAEVARRVPTLIIAGNHDRRGLKRHLPWGAPGLTVVDDHARVVLDGLVLAAVAYRKDAASFSWHARRAVGAGADLLVAHQAFEGVVVPPGLRFRVGAQRDTVGEMHLPRVAAVLCGHIHPRQVVTVGGIPVVHPGATERTSFSERACTMGYAIWEVGRGVRWTFVDLPSRPMVRVEGSADLAAVVPGTLVRARNRGLAAEALQRGGWVATKPDWHPAMRQAPPPSPQLALFRA